ncbi:hypothetical protein [Edaphobacter sp.]|uniref:hypothetical protein n=1 Tax=Edaphobacter sp. TaxID=1934404 RepID=UPI002DB6642E|nr:hypothetical protein [Edaphobacter sp.]HEU5340291.1 hypothetical protein [Edaphobacter sp.]
MKPKSKISSIWNDSTAASSYLSGVSLHSHTSFSEESLTFIHKMFAFVPGLRQVFNYYERQSSLRGLELDFVRAHWRPPLQPRMAYDVELRQIEMLRLEALISITDHDNIGAPMLLRTIPSSRHIPVSVEWTVPFGATELHLGIHNLPSADGHDWMRRFAAYTAAPGEAMLRTILHELDDVPAVLVVLNHPIWDLHRIGHGQHMSEVWRFLEGMGNCIHALELNGLRDARENRKVVQLARETGHLLISGGDRHSLEPNANINLTQAVTFREFVDEIRVERRSHVLFMQQYATPWEQRILHSTLAAVTDYPEFIEGWRRWDDRAFHPDHNGEMRPLSQLWQNGRPPLPLLAAIQLVRMARSRTFSRTFSLAYPGSNNPHAELELL